MTTKNEITFNIEEINPCETKISLEVSVTRVRDSFRKAVDSYKSQAKVAGFREGKTPRAVIMKKYGEQIVESVQKNLIDEASRFALQENKNITPIMEVDSDIKSIEEGKAYSFSITFETRPEFSLPEYKGLKLEAISKEITDTAIDEKIETILQQQARLDVVDDIAKDEDFVKCTTQCQEELDEEVAKSVNGENRWIIMSDSGQFPGAKDLLLGKKAGDKVIGKINFPEDYTFNEELKNKSLEFEFSIVEVQRRISPEINDEFLKQNNVDNIEAFRDNICKALQQEQKSQRDGELTDKILTQLLEKVDCTLPQRTLEDQTKHIIHQMLHDKEQHQHTEECNHNPDDADEEIKKTAAQRAEKSLKTSFLIDKIAEKEEIKVEQNDLLERLQQISKMYNMPMDQLIKSLSESNELMQMQMQIKHEKTLQKIIELAEITEVTKNEQ